jgi:hypothetical protein
VVLSKRIATAGEKQQQQSKIDIPPQTTTTTKSKAVTEVRLGRIAEPIAKKQKVVVVVVTPPPPPPSSTTVASKPVPKQAQSPLMIAVKKKSVVAIRPAASSTATAASCVPIFTGARSSVDSCSDILKCIATYYFDMKFTIQNGVTEKAVRTNYVQLAAMSHSIAEFSAQSQSDDLPTQRLMLDVMKAYNKVDPMKFAMDFIILTDPVLLKRLKEVEKIRPQPGN